MKYNKEWNILEIEAFKIEGQCPVFQQGEKMIIRGPTIDLQQSDWFVFMPYFHWVPLL